jgi:hypothetical protein
MQFHLVYGGRMAGVVEESFELRGREIGDADVPGFALFDELGHGGPGVEVLDSVAEGCVGDGPVHVVQVKVVELEVGKGGVDSLFNVFAAMAGAILVCLICYEWKGWETY